MPRVQTPFEWMLERDMIYWQRLRAIRRKRDVRNIIVNLVLLLVLTAAVTVLRIMK